MSKVSGAKERVTWNLYVAKGKMKRGSTRCPSGLRAIARCGITGNQRGVRENGLRRRFGAGAAAGVVAGAGWRGAASAVLSSFRFVSSRLVA
jgi:hypothetical protein